MKIEMNTIYHLPTQAHEDDFLKQADKLGLRWRGEPQEKASDLSFRGIAKENFCIKTENKVLSWGNRSTYENNESFPIIEWKIGFSKADMQIGQRYKIRDGEEYIWEENDIPCYNDNLCYVIFNGHQGHLDIIEVYEMITLPTIWKREEPKYRVKTELTKEQAEKLGLEFCEEVKE